MDFLVEYKSAYYSHKSNFVGSLQNLSPDPADLR